MQTSISLMGEDFVVTIDYRITSPGYPAKLSGPPEDCYPAEGPEFEVESITLAREVFRAIPRHYTEGPAWELSPTDAQFDHICSICEDAIFEHACEQDREDETEYDEDYYRDFGDAP